MNPLYDPYVLILANAMWRADMDMNPEKYEFAKIDLETASYNLNRLAEPERRLQFVVPEMYLYRARAYADRLVGTASSGGLDTGRDP